MRIDTRQQLDIIYTTKSLLTVTPKDGHTSMMFTNINDGLPCLEYTTDDRCNTICDTMISLVIAVVSVCILIIHLLFKDLRNLFGKLLMFYNLAIVIGSIGVISLQVTHYWIRVNSQAVLHCHNNVHLGSFKS